MGTDCAMTVQGRKQREKSEVRASRVRWKAYLPSNKVRYDTSIYNLALSSFNLCKMGA